MKVIKRNAIKIFDTHMAWCISFICCFYCAIALSNVKLKSFEGGNSVTSFSCENNSLDKNNVDIVALNFDKVFPESPLYKLFDSCIKIYQEIDFACKNKDSIFFECKNRKENFEIFTDLIVGKLFDIKMGISKVEICHEDDIVYLNKIFDKILLEYKTTFASNPEFCQNPKIQNLPEIISEIKGVNRLK